MQNFFEGGAKIFSRHTFVLWVPMARLSCGDPRSRYPENFVKLRSNIRDFSAFWNHF